MNCSRFRKRTKTATQRAFAELKAGVDRAARLVEQLLTLARLEPERPSATCPVHLTAAEGPIVGARRSPAKNAATGHARTRPSRFWDPLPRARLANLLDNALVYAGRPPHRCRIDAADGHAVLS